jgi:hypothetical protein
MGRETHLDVDPVSAPGERNEGVDSAIYLAALVAYGRRFFPACIATV